MLELDSYYQKDHDFLTGIDEAGRGPLAGPLVVAAVTVGSEFELFGLDDSKKLSDKKRRELYALIPGLVVDCRVEIITVEKIDRVNILQATMQGMTQACLGLKTRGKILIDGNRVPGGLAETNAESIVKGDQKVSAIAAASILAKVVRDDLMIDYAAKYPGYGFERNKGYGTAEHLKAIHDIGITPIHRRSYAPVNQYTIDFEI